MDWVRVRTLGREATGSGLAEARGSGRRSQLSLVPARQELGQAARRSRISTHHARSRGPLEALQGTLRTPTVETPACRVSADERDGLSPGSTVQVKAEKTKVNLRFQQPARCDANVVATRILDKIHILAGR